MALVSTILTNVGYRLNKTISSSSEPTESECIQWANETLDWLLAICAEYGSELGTTVGSITTTELDITGITAADPPVVASASHGLSDGDVVTIANVVGMTEVNDLEFTVANKADNTFELSGIEGAGYTAYSSGGNIYMALYSDISSDFYAPVIYTEGDSSSFSGWIEKSTERVPLRLVTRAEKMQYIPGRSGEPECFFIDGSNYVNFLDTPDDAYVIKIPYYQVQSVSATTDTVPFNAIFDNLITESVVLRYLNRVREDVNTDFAWFSFVKERAERIVQQRMNPNIKVS